MEPIVTGSSFEPSGFDLIWDFVRGIFGRRPHDRADVQRISGNGHMTVPLHSLAPQALPAA